MPDNIPFTTDNLTELADHERRLRTLETDHATLQLLSDNMIKLTCMMETSQKEQSNMRADISDIKSEVGSLKVSSDLRKTKWTVIGAAVGSLIAAIAAIIVACL